MPTYQYICEECKYEFDTFLPVKDRDAPTKEICPQCYKKTVRRDVGCAGFIVPEGGVGNAKNGYSSYHGDSELFKAKGTPAEKQLKVDYKLN